jgi:hypothetical protein
MKFLERLFSILAYIIIGIPLFFVGVAMIGWILMFWTGVLFGPPVDWSPKCYN